MNVITQAIELVIDLLINGEIMKPTTLGTTGCARAREVLDQMNYSARKYKRPLILMAVGIIALVGLTVSINYCNHKVTITTHNSEQQGYWEKYDSWRVWTYDTTTGQWNWGDFLAKQDFALQLQRDPSAYWFYISKDVPNSSFLDLIQHNSVSGPVHLSSSNTWGMDYYQPDHDTCLSWGGSREVWIDTGVVDHISNTIIHKLQPLAITGAIASGLTALIALPLAMNTAKRIAQSKTEVEREEWKRSQYQKLEETQ
jgi:hypothetical protein